MHNVTAATPSPGTLPLPSPAEAYREVAHTIAAKLARTAIWAGDRCNWVGSAIELVHGNYQVVQRAHSADLYSGTAGIVLFLTLLLEQHSDAVLADTLEGAVNHVLADQSTADGLVNYAYYGGALGPASALIEAGSRLGRADWEEAGWERLANICAKPIQEFEVDIIRGVAGAIPVLLRYRARRPAPYLDEAVVRCGDFLVQAALKQPTAWSWVTLPDQMPLTGYSHGAAGIALALLKLYYATGNPTYYTGAMMGFNFERLLFNPDLQNWPDLRSQRPSAGTVAQSAAPVYADAWCHGAPGIALSRLQAWQLTGDETFRQEAELALSTTHRSIYNLLANPTAAANFSLCHGLAGNADCMLEGSRLLNNPLFQQVAEAVGNHGLEKYHRTRLHWPSGVNDPTGLTAGMGETPGLLLGLAGVGYFYLRLAYPSKIDSLLVL